MARTRFALLTLGVILSLLAFPTAAVVPPLRQPTWSELDAAQQRILAPLASEWDKLESYRRKKWLGIAKRYPAMAPEEQARVQRRMVTWAKMTPEERKVAREKYLALQKATPEQKATVSQQWQEYKALPDAEKSRLKAEAQRKPSPKTPIGRPATAKAPVVAPSPPSPSPSAN